jgi:class 3 adenylate cyclase
MLFTDIEGSTRMLDRLGERFGDVVREHDRVMREAVLAVGGREVSFAGDSFFAVFDRAWMRLSARCSLSVGLPVLSGRTGRSRGCAWGSTLARRHPLMEIRGDGRSPRGAGDGGGVRRAGAAEAVMRRGRLAAASS